MCPNRDPDLNHATGAVQGTAIERNAIRRQNRDPNLVPDQNLHRDLGQDQGVSLVVNDRAATIIRCQHCQGKNFMQILSNINVNFMQSLLFSFFFYIDIMVGAENHQASN